MAKLIGLGKCFYKTVRKGHCIYKLCDDLTVLQSHLTGSKPQNLFFLHPFMKSLTPVMDFSICMGSDIVV